MSYNHVGLQGNLTRDPELRHTADGKPVANFTLAHNDGWGDNEHCSFVDVTAWGKTAEFVAKHFTKGKAAMVGAKLRQEKWQTKEGENRSKIVLVAFSVDFAGGKAGDGPGESVPPVPAGAPAVADDDSDMPF